MSEDMEQTVPEEAPEGPAEPEMNLPEETPAKENSAKAGPWSTILWGVLAAAGVAIIAFAIALFSKGDGTVTFQLSVPYMDLEIGQSETMVCTITPAKYQNHIEWSSSDDRIATVDQDGLVTGVGGGTAIITIRTGEYKTIFRVTVSDLNKAEKLLLGEWKCAYAVVDGEEYTPDGTPLTLESHRTGLIDIVGLGSVPFNWAYTGTNSSGSYEYSISFLDGSTAQIAFDPQQDIVLVRFTDGDLAVYHRG